MGVLFTAVKASACGGGKEQSGSAACQWNVSMGARVQSSASGEVKGCPAACQWNVNEIASLGVQRLVIIVYLKTKRGAGREK